MPRRPRQMYGSGISYDTSDIERYRATISMRCQRCSNQMHGSFHVSRALAIPRFLSIMSHPVRHITVLSCGHNVQVAWLICQGVVRLFDVLSQLP